MPAVAQPAMRQPGARPRRRVVVQLGVAGERGLGGAIGDDRARPVALSELDPVGVELIVLELQGLAELCALGGRLRGAVGAGAHPLVHLVGIGGVGESQRGEDRPELLDRLVRAQHDLLADRGPLGVEAVEQLRSGRPPQHVGKLPAQVVGVLDRRVRAQAVGRRMAMDRVAHAEHAALAIARCVHLVVAPQRRRADRHRDRVVADQVVDDLDRRLVVELGWGLRDVIPPHDQPLVPRADHSHQSHPDSADVRARLQHPVQDARPVLNLGAQIGVEDDVHRAGHVHLALERQADFAGDDTAPTVGADHVAGVDLVFAASDPVAYGDRHVVGMLLGADVLGVKADARAASGGVADQDRLEQRLGQIAVLRRAGQRVIGLAGGMGAPRSHTPDLVAREAGAEHGVAHQPLGGAVGLDVGLDAQVSEDLDGPLVGDVGARRVRRPRVLGDDDVLDPERGERQGRRAARRPGPDDEYVGGDAVGHVALTLFADWRSCRARDSQPGRVCWR